MTNALCVRTGMGSYSEGQELYTSSLTGCLATLLFFEDKTLRKSILTHYLPLQEGTKPKYSFLAQGFHREIDKNLEKITELKQKCVVDEYFFQRGIILVPKIDKASKLLERGVQELFPSMSLELVIYDLNKPLIARINPALRIWMTEQHGINFF